MLKISNEIKSIACFSEDRNMAYRYSLTRQWDSSKKKATIVMLNPSKATDLKYDISVMNVHNFFVDYEDESYGSYSILNLFAYRATDPKLLEYRDLNYEKENEKVWDDYFKESDIIVVAWGRDFSKVNVTLRNEILSQISKIENRLKQYQNKLFIFWDGKEKLENIKSRHPVVLKKSWTLIQYKVN